MRACQSRTDIKPTSAIIAAAVAVLPERGSSGSSSDDGEGANDALRQRFNEEGANLFAVLRNDPAGRIEELQEAIGRAWIVAAELEQGRELREPERNQLVEQLFTRSAPP